MRTDDGEDVGHSMWGEHKYIMVWLASNIGVGLEGLEKFGRLKEFES